MVGEDVAPDRELVEAVRAGNTSAFSTLYVRHAAAVRREIGRTTEATAVVDLAQDVFVRALEALPSLRDPALFRPWVLSIARRAAIDQRRVRWREQPLDDARAEELSDGDRRPDDVAELHDLAVLVQGTVAGLSRRDAAAVRMVVDLGFSPDELALALGVTPGAARVIVHRAKRRLRDVLVLELLRRREIDGCPAFVRLHDNGDVVGAARHVRQCMSCRDSARHEMGLRSHSRVEAGYPDSRVP